LRNYLQEKKSELYAALRTELHRHDFSTFVDEPPSVAQGGNGVVVPGCPMCKKRLGTTAHFLDHLTDDVLPAVLDGLSAEKVGGAIKADSVRNPRGSVSRTSVSPNANS